MESTRTKVELMKPVLLKAGIPLAISVAGFIYAKILARRRNSASTASSLKTEVRSREIDSCEELRDDESFHSPISWRENEEQAITIAKIRKPIESLDLRDEHEREEEILALKHKIEDLQDRELRLERRFFRYHDMKEQESVLMERMHLLLLETVRLEFLDREISSLEAENRTVQSLVMEYFKVLELLEFWKSENRLLHRKVKKLMRKAKDRRQIMKAKNLELEGKEVEILRNYDEVEKKNDLIGKLEGQVMELRTVIGCLEEEKNGLLNELELAQNVSKIGGQNVKLEDYNKLLYEIEQLQKDRAVEVKEMIFLRWSNACLRHELMRNQQERNEERKKILALEAKRVGENGEYGFEEKLDELVLEQHGESCFGPGVVTSNQAGSKGQKLMKKLKKWVEGSEKMKGRLDGKERDEVKCFGKQTVSDWAEEGLHARNSCSSA